MHGPHHRSASVAAKQPRRKFVRQGGPRRKQGLRPCGEEGVGGLAGKAQVQLPMALLLTSTVVIAFRCLVVLEPRFQMPALKL